jgi:hypothetical protein
MDLAWGVGHDTARCLAPAKLREPHQDPFVLTQQGDHVRVRNFFRLNRLAVTGLTVKGHVLSGVHGSKGVPERLFSDRRQLLRIVATRQSYGR